VLSSETGGMKLMRMIAKLSQSSDQGVHVCGWHHVY
jgi:hypothetical protein